MRKVVTGFLTHKGKILLLQRSALVSTFQGKWAGVSGSIPEGATPLDQALQEIREETGLEGSEVELLRQGRPLKVVDEQQREWLVHPFLFEIKDPDRITLDWEHQGCRWIEPHQIGNFETVPGLRETWEQLWKS